ncbi:hypothetical protein [Arthrobacter globiformis]|uniref:hypothetical protein n=1 Tax=Arthrobacter globiformis TaxID=1665 RepID=UPI002790F927|nr:hypothetical protein [Arthrobacter globiformis]MDQ0618064.1 hypothetical protein [Arthrobacter globiformis]
MLAQILPGFRDFRTPLVTGYLWLLSTWILLGKPLPSKARKDGLLGMVNALTEYLSGAVVVVVLSFLAYMIGLLLAVDFKYLTALVPRYGYTRIPDVESDSKKKWKRVRIAEMSDHQRLLASDAGSRMHRLITEASARVEKREVPWESLYLEYKIPHPQGDVEQKYVEDARGDDDKIDAQKRKDGLNHIAPALLSLMEKEIPTMATKLQKENKDLYDSYDRHKSEADYRLSVAIPIAAISILILIFGLAVNPWLNGALGVIGLVTALILNKKGWTKNNEATGVIISALEIGTIKSNALDVLDGLTGPTILTETGDPVIR